MAISHVKSNTAVGWTGTVTVFNSQGSSGTAAASDMVLPSDWNSAHHNLLTLTGNTAGASTVSGTNIVYAGGNNITLSAAQGANVATISVVGNAQSVQTQNMVSVLGSTGNISFDNANGITFGGNASTITASHNGLTTAALSDHSHGNPTLALTNLSGTTASNSAGFTLSLSAGAGGAGDGVNIIAAGTQTANTTGSVLFNNANGITFGMSNSSVVTASHNALTSQSNQALSGSNGSFTFQTATFGDLNGLSFYTSNGSLVGSYTVPTQSNQTAGIYAVGNTTGQSSSSTYDARTLSVDGAGIVSAGWSNGTLRISATQSNQAFSADASSTFQTLSFQDSNGVSFSNNAGALRVTHALQFTSATSAITSNALHSSASRVINIVAATNNAAGGTASLSSNVSFSAANGLTFYTSAGNAIVGSYTVPTVTNSSMTVSDAATSGTLARLAFTNLNGITLSLSTGAGGSHTIVGSYTVPTQTNQTLGLYAVGNTTGQSSSSTFDARTISFVGQGIASVGFSAGSVNISVPAGGGGITNVNISAGTTSQNLSNFVFSNSNGVSFGLNGSTITGSVAAGGGGGITASFYPPYPHPMATSSMVSGTTAATGGSSQTTAAFYLAPMVVDQDIHYNQVRLYASGGTAAGTGSWSAGHMVGLYTLNGGTAFSLDRTFVLNARLSQNSVTAHSMRVYWGTDSNANSTSWGGNSSASMTGWREALLHTGASTLTRGVYYIAVGFTHRTSGVSVGGIGSVAFISLSQTTAAPRYGTNTAVPYLPRHIGSFTTTSNNTTTGFVVLPNSIHTSALTYTGGSSQYRWPIIHMASS